MTKYNKTESLLLRLFGKKLALYKKSKIGKLFSRPQLIQLYIENLAARLLKKDFKIKTTTFWGRKMNLLIPEQVSWDICRYGFFEESLTKSLLNYLKPGMVFIDIGAHFGFFSLLASELVGKEGEVHCFEPTRNTFMILESNVLDISNIFPNNKAVFSSGGKLCLKDYGFRFSAWNSVYTAKVPREINNKLKFSEYEVDAISIDEFVSSKKIKPDFIKIDAEGAEFEILQGANKVLELFRPNISLEVADADIEGIRKYSDCVQLLVEKEYVPYDYKDGKLFKHVIKQRYAMQNLFFIHKTNITGKEMLL